MKLFKNKEVRLSIGISVVLLLTFGAVLMYIFSDFAKTLNAIQIKQNIAVIGTVAKKYPELETDIVKNYTGEFQKDYEYGKNILKKYSYDESLSVDKNSFIQKDVRQAYIRIQIIIALFTLILITFLLLSFYRIFSRIRRISVSAEAVIEGKYESIDGDNEEGDIGFLTYQFNTMTERLGENVQTLSQEKLFLKKLITDISHQLKTPLASLVMFNDIMENDNTISGKDRSTFLIESKNQLDRMEWLIKNMLKMAKLEAAVVDFDKKEACVAHTLQRSMLGLKLIAAQKNINMKVSGDISISVKHDISWTTEAFSNIIKNCIEHSEPGSEINISWEENSVFVQVIIQDNGAGIPKEELPKIFDRFYKGPNSCTPTNIGIGLYITKTIIEGQGGSVYAFSQIGQGTKFIVRLMKIG
ncbi:MAG TPA: HAMP domain-containing sensor histidine kinase [Ruminiclostridium sp.]